MIYGLYLSSAGAKAQSYRQDVIANNVANVDTTGFRRQYAIIQERKDHASEYGAPPTRVPSDPRNLRGGAMFADTPTDVKTPGSYKATSRNLDLAINGAAFFQVMRDGKVYLTRNGRFHLDGEGVLRADDDGIVMTRAGDPLKVDGNLPIAVGPAGDVVQNDIVQGEITIVEPLQPERMRRAGRAEFTYDGAVKPSEARIEQNLLEGSNVEPVSEMVDLIESSRGFEMNIQFIQLQSDGLANLIQTVPRLA